MIGYKAMIEIKGDKTHWLSCAGRGVPCCRTYELDTWDENPAGQPFFMFTELELAQAFAKQMDVLLFEIEYEGETRPLTHILSPYTFEMRLAGAVDAFWSHGVGTKIAPPRGTLGLYGKFKPVRVVEL